MAGALVAVAAVAVVLVAPAAAYSSYETVALPVAAAIMLAGIMLVAVVDGARIRGLFSAVVFAQEYFYLHSDY